MLVFGSFYSSNNSGGKKYSTLLFIDNNNKMFFKQQISILKWFLKDHVTLKPGVMMLKNHSFESYILQYIQSESSYFK